jgi:hypothetical protein
LEHLEVTICTLIEGVTSWPVAWDIEKEILLGFHGQGSTPADRVASMQRQISAFSTTLNFLHPTCWPGHPCLISIDINTPFRCRYQYFSEGSMFLITLLPFLRVPSLVDLAVDFGLLPILPTDEDQSHVSSLLKLTSLTFCTNAHISAHLQTLWESAGLLTNLRSIDISQSLASPEAGGAFTIPATWQYLSRLTKLAIPQHCITNLAALSMLPAVQSLLLTCADDKLGDIIRCSAQVSSLTELVVLHISRNVAIQQQSQQQQQQQQQQEGSILAQSATVLLRSPWSNSTLRTLDLWGFCITDVPLQRLPGLTQLSLMGRTWQQSEPGPRGTQPREALPEGQMMHLADLQLLRKVELAVKVTPELCWYVLSMHHPLQHT